MLEEIAPRDARAEAQHVLGPNARVLDISRELLEAEDQRALALAFFEDRLAELAA